MYRLFLLSLLLSATQVQAGGVAPDAESVTPRLPGTAAPAFTARDAEGQAFHFEPEALKKPVVLVFYRGGWCPWCNTQLGQLRAAESDLRAMGFDLLFVSADRPEKLYASLNEENTDVGYTLLSDSSMEIAQTYGVAFKVSEEYRLWLLERDKDIEVASGETHHVLPVPSVFLIDKTGTIQFQYSNPNYKVRLHPDVLLAAARVLRDE
jgi:peroxiredoxin